MDLIPNPSPEAHLGHVELAKHLSVQKSEIYLSGIESFEIAKLFCYYQILRRTHDDKVAE